MATYTVCFNIGFAVDFEGDSPEEVEDFIRNVMSDNDFNRMVISGMEDGEIEIEVVSQK